MGGGWGFLRRCEEVAEIGIVGLEWNKFASPYDCIDVCALASRLRFNFSCGAGGGDACAWCALMGSFKSY